MNLTKVLVLMTVLAVVTLEIAAAKISPILIFPGIMGSRLMVRDTREGICNTKPNKWAVLWIGNQRILSKNTDRQKTKEKYWQCSLDELELDDNYDQKTKGVTVKASYSLDGVRVLTISKLTWFASALDYFHAFVKFFIKAGYRKEISIKAVPYDFRHSAAKLEETGYFGEVKARIEQMYAANKDTKVTLVAHSMGALISHYFLTEYDKIDQTWKDKYIHAYVTLAGAWSGGVQAVAGVIINVAPEGINLPAEKMVPVTRTYESIPYIFPRLSVFTTDPVVIKTKTKEYKVSDYEQLFKDLGIEKIFTTFERVSRLNDLSKAPGVPTYCYYGTNLNTPEMYTFDKDFSSNQPPFNWKPKIKLGKGDGTVNDVSGQVCTKWVGVTHEGLRDVEHTEIVKKVEVFKKIKTIATIATQKEKEVNQVFQRLLYQYIH